MAVRGARARLRVESAGDEAGPNPLHSQKDASCNTSAEGLLFGSDQVDIKMRSHRMLRIDG